jgi:poly-gamma-glutamate capsule biosynthesis protein CapA/YwtB (metallophosphatase superfamily)
LKELIRLRSRAERHSKSKSPSKRKVFTLKRAGLLVGGAVLCFTIGIGLSYVTTHFNKQQAAELPSEAPPSSTTPTVPPKEQTTKPSPTTAPSAIPVVPTSPTPTPNTGAGSQVKLSFVGDVLLASRVEDEMKKFGYDYPYSAVKDYLQKADYTVANLESPFTTRGEAQVKQYAFRSSPLAIPALVQSGIDMVNLANNHILDYGEVGLLDTMKELDKAGIRRIGAGADADEAYKPIIVDKQGIKIAFLGFSRVVPDQSWKAGKNHPGVAETYSHVVPVESIKKAREQADLVVVIAHWGIEREDNPDKNQKELAHRYIDAGADLIVGGHPHVVQGFEQYKGKWIAYSLGNFIFTLNPNSKTWNSMILEATCTKEKQCELQVVPVITKLAKPELMAPEQGAALLEHLTKISINAKLTKDGKVTAASN